MRNEPPANGRRTLMRAGLLALLGLGLPAAARRARAQQKIAKDLVLYQESPKNGQSCAICAHFQPASSCAIVAGTISPNGWCGVFTPKT